MMTPMSRVAGLARIVRQTSNPLSRGIMTSSRTTSGFHSVIRRRASSPLAATLVSCGVSDRKACGRAAIAWESSDSPPDVSGFTTPAA